eukprot:8337846-Alexandrium_andersonii.AAC.1
MPGLGPSHQPGRAPDHPRGQHVLQREAALHLVLQLDAEAAQHASDVLVGALDCPVAAPGLNRGSSQQ